MDRALAWITANNGEVARRLGIMYVLWNQRIWVDLLPPNSGWRKMASRGSYTANHKNHVHISLTWDGAMKQTSWWTGVPVTVPLTYKCGISGQPKCLPTISRAASTKWPYQKTLVPVPFLPAPGSRPKHRRQPASGPDSGRRAGHLGATRGPRSATSGSATRCRSTGLPQPPTHWWRADYNKVIRVKVTATVGDAVTSMTSAGTAEIYRWQVRGQWRPADPPGRAAGGRHPAGR